MLENIVFLICAQINILIYFECEYVLIDMIYLLMIHAVKRIVFVFTNLFLYPFRLMGKSPTLVASRRWNQRGVVFIYSAISESCKRKVCVVHGSWFMVDGDILHHEYAMNFAIINTLYNKIFL